MGKWTHVFIGPSQDGLFDVAAVAAGSTQSPAKIKEQMPHLVRQPGCEQVCYVGSGRGDWWDRTMNTDDPLATRFAIRRLTGQWLPYVALPPVCFTERLP